MNAYVREIFRQDTGATPWPRMLLCGAGAILPLLFGLHQGEVGLSVYGALVGYLLGLNDHLGHWLHRLIVLHLSIVMLCGGFALGLGLRDLPNVFDFALVVIVYGLGLFGGEGAELERSLLFATLALVIGHATPPLEREHVLHMFAYALVSYGVLLAGVPLVALFRRSPSEPYANLRDSLRQIGRRQSSRHIHAVSYAFTAWLSLWVARQFSIERGYWAVITVLLVMKPDRRLAIYKTCQRFIGTMLGVLFSEAVIYFYNRLELLQVMVLLSATAVPWALRRNYLFVSFLATVLVVSLLEITFPQHGDLHLPLIRLRATLLGCSLALLGTGVAEALHRLLLLSRKMRSQEFNAKSK